MKFFDRFKKNKKEGKVLEKEADVELANKIKFNVKKTQNDSDVVKNKENKEEKIKSKIQVESKSHSVLVKSVVSEKSALAEGSGVYSFVVQAKANKFDIKKAVKEIYGVIPKKVRVLNVEGKHVSFGQRKGKRSDWKKAVVTLPKGKTINIHEGV